MDAGEWASIAAENHRERGNFAVSLDGNDSESFVHHKLLDESISHTCLTLLIEFKLTTVTKLNTDCHEF